MANNVIEIVFSTDLSIGRTSALGGLLNKLRYKMEYAAWRKKALETPEDDHHSWENLEREYESIGLP